MKTSSLLLSSLTLALTGYGATNPADTPATATPAAAPADKKSDSTAPAAALAKLVVLSVPNPRAVTVDRAGNLYVGDFSDALVYRITPDGTVTTWGAAAPAAPGKPASAAAFTTPSGLAVDASGNIFVADVDGGAIHQISPAGAITTLANSDNPLIAGPISVAVDGAGNVFVANNSNSTVAKIAHDGTVSTFAGQPGKSGNADGKGAAASFASPRGISSDADGNLIVADEANSNIRKITPAGEVSTLAAGTTFGGPRDAAVDAAGNVYVADTDNSIIRKISPKGEVTTLAGQMGQSGAADGKGAAASFSGPRSIAVDPAGNVYVADSDNGRIRRITPAGEVTTVVGPAGN